eukprot:PhM_4_TR11330/c3_g1_i1/m.103935
MTGVLSWTTSDVVAWVRRDHTIAHLASLFDTNDINGRVLTTVLTRDDLQDELRIHSLVDRKNLWNAISSLKTANSRDITQFDKRVKSEAVARETQKRQEVQETVRGYQCLVEDKQTQQQPPAPPPPVAPFGIPSLAFVPLSRQQQQQQQNNNSTPSIFDKPIPWYQRRQQEREQRQREDEQVVVDVGTPVRPPSLMPVDYKALTEYQKITRF